MVGCHLDVLAWLSGRDMHKAAEFGNPVVCKTHVIVTQKIDKQEKKYLDAKIILLASSTPLPPQNPFNGRFDMALTHAVVLD